jgi:hypothetical protein
MCEIVTKTCRKCGENKNENLFRSKEYTCKKCIALQDKERHIKDVECLSNSYIRRTISRRSGQPDYSLDNIIKVRNSIIKARGLIAEEFRLCPTCNDVFEKNSCKNAVACKKCTDKSFKLSKKQSSAIYCRKWVSKAREQLNDAFIKSFFARNFWRSKIKISAKNIPQELIELKRKELILKRKIKSHGKEKAPN